MLLKPVVWVLRGLSLVAFLAIPFLLVAALLPSFEGANSYPWVGRVLVTDAIAMDWIRSFVPTEIGQLDLARAFLILAALVAGALLDLMATGVSSAVPGPGEQKKRRKKKPKKKKKAVKPATEPEAGDDGPKSREELVRVMVEAKRELDAMTKELSFFALDVVESTNMKLGEDPAFIEHDFKEFKKMVDGVVGRERPLKAAWTPDGAMICFDSFEGSVRAAQETLKKLPEFNSGTRMMSTRFRIRCGINAGRVQYDESTPMEEMSDNVIDVAGHMQKYADPDTLYVATELLERSKVERGFDSAGTEVDGYDVSVWRGPSADPVETR